MPKRKTKTLNPEVGLKWSKKMLVWSLIVSIALAFIAIFGFLFYKEYQKKAVEGFSLPSKKLAPDVKNYTNDYWGFKLKYPGSWWPVIGSYQDGEYYFSSEPINFISELADDQALVKIETYMNIKNLSFEDWVKDRDENYFPRGKTVKTKLEGLKGFNGWHYIIQPNRPLNNISYLDMLVLTSDSSSKKIYLLILETKNIQANQKYQEDFKTIVGSFETYEGFGN